ncbi:MULTISPECIES: carboxypeptidase regulatory-like domain-containing protein [unclassified Bacteroides]|jgi:hypothetical protein|uniref:carboxypeptidase regulatory-like domain-containing protein n=1 Tax=unclassified Bacteroides TaxID=2646097 RepID=UPI000E9A4A8F|nr:MULTISPECIES: carboxypeptidase regulatory-like domain-containing protein [unclassified Bacteroides]RGN42968.1 T9SS C-terminal target domain-containing protein [Bacteroides sp. OM05-12]RHR70463.1 T9SS C-terminal target domain-containing protein [Bacteroides sp. AF16-49]
MKKYLLLSLVVGILISVTFAFAETGNTLPSDLKQTVKQDRTKASGQIKNKQPRLKKAPAYYPKAYQTKKIYGFQLASDGSDEGFVEFNLKDLSTTTVLFPDNPDYINFQNLVGGAYGDGTYYYFNGTDASIATEFDKIDLSTGKKTILSDYYTAGLQVIKPYDMTYDYSTHTMYGLITSNKDNFYAQRLVTIRLTDGYAEDVAILNAMYSSLAASYDGHLYAIKENGYLVELNKKDGTEQKILETGYIPKVELRQSMEFDHTDGSLYWALSTKDYEGNLIKIDIQNKEAIDLGTLGENAQISGMYIPFLRNNLNAPAAAENLKLTPETGGKHEATLSWKNPELTINEDPLSSITKVEVYRNDELVKTYESPTKGQTMSFKETNVPNGFNTYKIVAFNSAGEGAPATVTGFVGRDVPDAVTDITLSKTNATSIELTWESPEKGVSGGWIDQSTLTYNIVRFPDSTVVKSNFAEQTYTENNLTNLKTYYYRIEPQTADGKGEIAESEHIQVGEYCSIPYQTNFIYPDESDLWTIIDANEDDFMWDFDAYLLSLFFPESKPGSAFFSGWDSDDWIISPPIKLEKGKHYEVTFDSQIRELDITQLEVSIGKESTVESQKMIRKRTLTNTDFQKEQILLPVFGEDGNYHIGIRVNSTDTEQKQIVRLTYLEVKETTAGSVRGKIISDGAPIEGVTISYKQEDKIITSAQTDAEGNYEIPYIAAGTYSCIVDKEGYSTIEKEVTVEELASLTLDYSLFLRGTSKITGKIVDARNQPVADAAVRLTGYKTYQTRSKEDGSFEIPDVYNASYQFIAFKIKHEQFTRQISVNEDMVLGDLQLEDKLLPPTGVKVDADNTKSTVMWQEPVDIKTFRYDDGTVRGVRGYNGGMEATNLLKVLGSVYRQAAILTGMSWYTVEDGYRDHDTVDIFVFDLDENGEPYNKILYHASNVLNKTDKWMTHTFEQPVECPNGFVIALSCDGFASLGVDDGAGSDYPFHAGTQCGSKDYTLYPFSYIENESGGDEMKQNFMLRAEGVPVGPEFERIVPANQTMQRQIPMEKGSSVCKIETRLLDTPVETKSNISNTQKTEETYHPAYNVYRFKETDEKTPDNWNLLTTEPVNESTYQDRSWSTLSKGVYKYAVEAVYTGNKVSDAVITGKAGKDMATTITVTLSTNLEGASTEGAVVQLSSTDNRYTGKADASGKAVLSGVWKDNYELSVMTLGCETYTKKVDYSTNNEYQENIQLKEKIVTPNKLKIENTEKTDERMFSWNSFKISDDFESHQDFAINSPGSIGWSYIDGDGAPTINMSTLTHGDIVHPGMNSPMAYIIFNPALTKPSLEGTIVPHSGDKVLACYSASHAVNNDYIISPELNTPDDFTFSFYAYSFGASENNYDKIRIGYSFTGKEETDFIWLTQTPIDIEDDYWTPYSYTIPAGARYVTINCVSEHRMILLIDDIYIGTQTEGYISPTNGIGHHTYEIYLDGKKVATQNETTYLFTKLEDGNHTAGVKAVYATESTAISTINFEISGSSIENVTDEEVTLYPIPVKDRLYIDGQYDKLSIYDVSGMLKSEYDKPVSSIDVTNLNTGVYMVKIISGDKTLTKKLIIENN